MRTRDRVCCYITRGRELLVYEYAERYTEGCEGVLVVGGGVDEGESWEDATLREAFEESGLALSSPVFLGTQHREAHVPEFGHLFERRHYFWLAAPLSTPDAWDHTVSAGDMDKGMVLKHRFVPLERAGLSWEFGALLGRLETRLCAPHG